MCPHEVVRWNPLGLSIHTFIFFKKWRRGEQNRSLPGVGTMGEGWAYGKCEYSGCILYMKIAEGNLLKLF
jgi:hypothetical protein